MVAIAGGGTSAVMLEPIKEEIRHLQEVNVQTASAISTVVNSLDALQLTNNPTNESRIPNIPKRKPV